MQADRNAGTSGKKPGSAYMTPEERAKYQA